MFLSTAELRKMVDTYHLLSDNNCNTPVTVPYSPANIKAVSVSPDCILVSWLPPVPDTGQLTGYTIHSKTMLAGQQMDDTQEVRNKGILGYVIAFIVLLHENNLDTDNLVLCLNLENFSNNLTFSRCTLVVMSTAYATFYQDSRIHSG